VASIGNTGASCAALEGSTEQVTVTLPQDNIDLGPCPQHCKSPAEQGAREGDVASSCEGGMAAGELHTGSNSLGFRAAVAHDSEPLSPSPLSAVCCDNFRSPHDPSHADTEVSARAGVTTPIRQHGVMASGQPEVFTPAAITTPTNITADELVLEKAKRRAAIRNLDNPVGTPSPGYLLNYALAPYVGYPSEAYFTGQACSGISFLGTGGQGFFCPGTWVAV